eukprot:NODE_688_length_1427_cov_31934.936139_g388_i2.p1 GENE.NODE_688_length_1427_cov_31934.936139_g388_i2~~NODE_688_length_1427_cov_31934.936139_g388_i2.p1  ORF type:complete len:365 (+),score=-70.04 NODE_688_length_1427_cov_31934.936139_g388_i2:188-1282(+)
MNIPTYRNYSTTALLTPAYSLGFTAGLALGIQWVTGFFVSCHYQASAEMAFWSVGQLCRDLDSGFLLRSIHANGATLFMVAVYGHMFRTLWYGSNGTKPLVWLVGVVLYLLLIGTCFTGYSLVYGNMSLWAIVVICSLVTCIPGIGVDLLSLVWGGSVVSGATVNRLFSVHFLLPIIVTALALLHVWLLHSVNSTGDSHSLVMRSDRINFFPIYITRDVAIGTVALVGLGYYSYFDSDAFGHPDNYVPANPMLTPAAIAPEWYMLPFYGLVRAIPSKIVGFVGMKLVFASLINLGDNGMRIASTSTALTRALLLILSLDVIMCSKVCLMVNHAETLYWLLLANTIGFCCIEMSHTKPVTGTLRN